MAKYAISQSGIESLNRLSSDLALLNQRITDANSDLRNKILAINDELGEFGDEILSLSSQVASLQTSTQEEVSSLCVSIQKLASEVEAILSAGI